nr:MAG TPA: hypothetical protein [Caudoviricetes sp.]
MFFMVVSPFHFRFFVAARPLDALSIAHTVTVCQGQISPL